MTVFAVYETASGNLRSVGSTVANPLPGGLTSVALSDPDALSLSNGTGRWDPATRTVVAVTPTVQETNQVDLLNKIDTAKTANDNWLAIANPTNAQAIAYLDTVARELTGAGKLIRALYGQLSALDDTTGT